MSITTGPLQRKNIDTLADGDEFYKTNYDEKTGAARAYAGFDANSTIITSVLPGTNVPVQSGLNLTQTYLGYYNGAEWMSYMNINGEFYLGGTDGSLQWNGTTLLIGGDSQLIFGTRIIPGANILSPDVRLWHETTVPSGIGYWTEGSNPYGYDPYGSGEENNSIISTLNPFGYQDLVWECNVVSGGEEAGGWAYNTYDIDKTLRYRHTIWAKFIGGIGRDMFFGCGNTGHTSDLTFDDSDSVNNNPYFASGLELPNAIHYYDNPVANPSMELNANWTAHGNPISCQRSAVRKFDGAYSWYVDLFAADVGSGAKSDEFTLEGYQTYRFSIWLYGADLTTKWHIYIDDGEQRHWIKEFGYENSYVSYDDWVNHVVNFQTGERSTTNRIYVVAAEMSDTAGAIYFDAVEVSTQLVTFGHFDDVAILGQFYNGWTHVGTPISAGRSEIGIAHTGTYSRKTVVDAIEEGIKTSKYQIAIGSSTTTSGGELIDSTASFQTANVAVDDIIAKLSGPATFVTDVVSQTQLSVNDDIFEQFDSYVINSPNSYLKLMAGYQYRASIWLLGDGITEWNAKVSDGIADYNFLETDNTPSLVPSGIWIQYMMDFEPKNNTEEGYFSLTSASAISGSATVYIDDVEIQETPWYLLTGFVHPDDYAGTESWGNLYHYKIGYSSPAYSGIDYKSLNATAVQGFRCFQTNSDDNEENKLFLYSPAVHVVDGSEPSLSTLLGNSLNMAWNVEHTTSISRYLLSSPTIRGGNYAGGNYVQMDAYGIRGFGAGINTFTLDAITGNVTVTDGVITGGIIQTSTSGTRVVIEGGSANNLRLYDSGGIQKLVIDDNIMGNPGISMNRGGIIDIRDDPSSWTKITTIREGNITLGGSAADKSLHIVPTYSGDTDNENVLIYNLDSTNNTYERDRTTLKLLSRILNSSNNSNVIGLSCSAYTTGTGTSVGAHIITDDIGLRLEDYSSTETTDFKVDTDGYLHITPTGTYTYINSSIIIPDGDFLSIVNTQWRLGRNLVSYTNEIVTGDAFQFHTWTGSTNGFQFGAFDGGDPWFEILKDGDINFTGAMHQSNSIIISSTGRQTGLYTLVPLTFAINGTIISSDDWFRGINNTDPGQYVLPFDCILVAATLRTTDVLEMNDANFFNIYVYTADGYGDSSFSQTVQVLNINNSDDGNYGKSKTDLSTAFQANDAIRAFVDVFVDMEPGELHYPTLTLWFLTKAN